MSVIPTA